MTAAPSTPAQIAAGLRALADEYESGYRAVPGRGQGVRRVGGAPVVPIVVHDALCGWRIATLQEDSAGASDGPPVQACAGCGMAYQQSDAVGRR